MQNSIDRQRLLRRFGTGPTHPAALVAKCAGGLVILIVLLLVSTHADTSAGLAMAQASAARH